MAGTGAPVAGVLRRAAAVFLIVGLSWNFGFGSSYTLSIIVVYGPILLIILEFLSISLGRRDVRRDESRDDQAFFDTFGFSGDWIAGQDFRDESREDPVLHEFGLYNGWKDGQKFHDDLWGDDLRHKKIGASFLHNLNVMERREVKHAEVYNPRDIWTPSDIEVDLMGYLQRHSITKQPSSNQDLKVPETNERSGTASTPVLQSFQSPKDIAQVPKLQQTALAQNSVTQSPDKESPQPIPDSPKPPIRCSFPGCERTFTAKHKRNRHLKSHAHLAKCQYCGRGFETIKDVNRHVNSVHETTTIYYCSVEGCALSKSGGVEGRAGGFRRRDNRRRHMRKKHGIIDI